MPKGVPNKRCTPEYKAMVIETMQKEHMGYIEAMRAFGITARGQIQKWERIYLAEGAKGLAVEHRGRGSKGRYGYRRITAEEALR